MTPTPQSRPPQGDRWKLDAIGIAALLGLTAAAWFLAVQPVLAARQRGAADQQAFAAAHEQLADLGADVATARDQLTRASQERGLTLEPATRLTHRLMAINGISAASDVRLDDVQPARPAAGERYDLLPVRVAGAGSYAALAAFLHRLHAACPDVAVGSLTVTGTPSPTTKPATFTLDLAWYTRGTAARANAAKPSEPK